MQFSLQTVVDAFVAMPLWEVIAVVFGIAYVLLAAKESVWAWPFAFFGTLIYTLLFWKGALLSSSLLNFYYMIMAIYGYFLWHVGKDGEILKITSWPLSKNLMVIGIGLLLSVGIGYLSDTHAHAKHAYLDTFVMVFSVIATWMLAKKILENWLLWFVTDSVAVALYWKSGYHVTIVLFMLYVVLAVYGYRAWYNEFSKRGE